MATATITPDQNTVIAEIFIAAPPARVFEAITDPKQRAQWWGVKASTPQGVVKFSVTDARSDLRVGGKWSNDGVRGDGTPFRIEGTYLEIDPPRLLVHSRTADFVGDFETIVRWELEPRDVHGLVCTARARIAWEPARCSEFSTQVLPVTPIRPWDSIKAGARPSNGCEISWRTT
jgi:uncharacterized protein YndB with AHSA1/START domain